MKSKVPLRRFGAKRASAHSESRVIQRHLSGSAHNPVTNGLRIEPPAEGEVRVRNLVHRGAVRPVFKMFSHKLKRVVQCESLLEVDFAILLDASPFVTSFREQPVTFRLTVDGEPRWHVPDFLVEQGLSRIYVEIKYARDVNDWILQRTDLLRKALRQRGERYVLLTEKQIRTGTLLDNTKQILRRARYSLDETHLFTQFERLRSGASPTLRDWSWSNPGASDAVALAHLLMRGLAQVDMLRPLTPDTAVKVIGNEEVAPWPLAHSA